MHGKNIKERVKRQKFRNEKKIIHKKLNIKPFVAIFFIDLAIGCILLKNLIKK